MTSREYIDCLRAHIKKGESQFNIRHNQSFLQIPYGEGKIIYRQVSKKDLTLGELFDLSKYKQFAIVDKEGEVYCFDTEYCGYGDFLYFEWEYEKSYASVLREIIPKCQKEILDESVVPSNDIRQEALYRARKQLLFQYKSSLNPLLVPISDSIHAPSRTSSNVFTRDDFTLTLLGLETPESIITKEFRRNTDERNKDYALTRTIKELIEQKDLVSLEEKDLALTLCQCLEHTKAGDVTFFNLSEEKEVVERNMSLSLVLEHLIKGKYQDTLQILKIQSRDSKDIYYERRRLVETNMGVMPVEDYLEIVAYQCGFDSYAEFYEAGFRITDYEDVVPEELNKTNIMIL